MTAAALESWGLANNSTHGANPAAYARLPCAAVRDFAPITFAASVP